MASSNDAWEGFFVNTLYTGVVSIGWITHEKERQLSGYCTYAPSAVAALWNSMSTSISSVSHGMTVVVLKRSPIAERACLITWNIWSQRVNSP